MKYKNMVKKYDIEKLLLTNKTAYHAKNELDDLSRFMEKNGYVLVAEKLQDIGDKIKIAYER